MTKSKKKKRKLKKGICAIFLILAVIIASMVIILKNKSKNNVEKDPEVVNKEENVDVTPKKKKMSLIAVGDVLIHESVYKDAKEGNTYNFHKMFTEIEPIIKKYDLKFCNQESTIGGTVLGISGYPSFNSPDEIGDEIVNLGFNLISLANNHAFDKGEDAILYSNSFWKSKNVVTSGSYSSNEEKNDIKIYEKNGIKYAFFAYTTLSNRQVTKDYLVDIYDASKVSNDIDKVKDKVDVIIVSMHWGVEYSNIPTESQRQIAEYLSSLGVNLSIGTHPHVVQPVEYIGDTLVIYSLGNFISNQLSIGINPGIGLMVGMDIVVDEAGVVSFDNLYKELILSYASNSKNFKVVPFSSLDNNMLNDYKTLEEKYMKIVNGN